MSAEKYITIVSNWKTCRISKLYMEEKEKTGCKIICGAPMALAVKGLMMMMTSAHSG